MIPASLWKKVKTHYRTETNVFLMNVTKNGRDALVVSTISSHVQSNVIDKPDRVHRCNDVFYRLSFSPDAHLLVAYAAIPYLGKFTYLNHVQIYIA